MDTRRTTEAAVHVTVQLKVQGTAHANAPADPRATGQAASRRQGRQAAGPLRGRSHAFAWATIASGAASALISMPGAAQATSCEQVMAPIEARIRAKGVTDFHLEAVDQAASAPGQPVGTCDLGRKKILYVRGAASAAGAGRPAAAPPGDRASAPRVITECADGRVIEQGSCKKK